MLYLPQLKLAEASHCQSGDLNMNRDDFCVLHEMHVVKNKHNNNL